MTRPYNAQATNNGLLFNVAIIYHKLYTKTCKQFVKKTFYCCRLNLPVTVKIMPD